MSSSYTTNISLEKPANGDYNNTWNVPVNNDWDIVDQAIGGHITINVVGASGTVSLAATTYRNRILIVSGTLTANVNYQLPANVGGFWYIYNNTSGSYTVTFSSATGGGTSFVVPQSYTSIVICDGTNVGSALTVPSAAAGSNTQLQFNNSGALGASSSLTWGTSSSTFTGTIASGANTLVTTGVTGTIYAGMTLGTITGGTFTSPTTVVITGQISGTTGGAGSYSLSQTNTGGAGATVTTASITALSAPYVIGSLSGNAISANTAATVTGTTYAIGYLQIPQSSNTTVSASDVGKHLYISTGPTINPSIFSAGDSFVIVNSNASSAITITGGTGVTLRLAGTSTSGSTRTLASWGMASVLCVVGGSTPTFMVSGSGVS